MEVYSQQPESTYGFRKCREAVRAAAPTEEIARRYTEAKPLGGAWFDAHCPLPDHHDPDASFYIYPPGLWWCFECDRGGDVVDLEFLCGGYHSLGEAIVTLKEEFDVELPRRPEKRHCWQQRKQDICAAAAGVREMVRRERLFKVLVLSGPEFEIEDPKERRAAIKRAWKA
jgi:hypothetical protein